jgi:hypothetical protein
MKNNKYNKLWNDLKADPGYEASEDGKKCILIEKNKATHKKKSW